VREHIVLYSQRRLLVRPQGGTPFQTDVRRILFPEYEQFDLAFDSLALVSAVRVSHESGHSCVKIFIRQLCEERIRAERTFLSELRPISGQSLPHDFMGDRAKSGRLARAGNAMS
jgi:hypothetical protein